MAVVADLPALDAASVEEIVAGFTGASTGFVADASGLGTTAYLAVSYDDFDPRFGPGSAEAHRSAGAREIDVPKASRARDDIDTPDDLEHARAHVGAHTRRALVALGI
jgi:2-phospho-L-lactate guanylyltransferase